MADYTYEQMKHLTVDELREIAAGLEDDAVKGYTQLNKDHLIPVLCKALGIDHTQSNYSPDGRPFRIVKDKAAGPVEGLFA